MYLNLQLKNAAPIRVTGSRVLTSAEGYAMLHKNEEKKKKKRKINESKKENRREREKKRLRKKLKKWPKKVSQRTKCKGKMQTTNDSTSTIPTPVSRGVTCDLRPVNPEKPAASNALPDQDGSQVYESCECFGTFEED